MLLIVSAAVPEFVRVTVCAALDVPTVWLAYVKLAGDSVTAGAGVDPPLLNALRMLAVVFWIPALT